MIACIGNNKAQCTLDEMIQRLETLPGAAKPMFALRHGPTVPKSVCVVSGSGADTLQRASQNGFLITSFESSGEYNKAELVAITLESSWTISLIDNDFKYSCAALRRSSAFFLASSSAALTPVDGLDFVSVDAPPSHQSSNLRKSS